MTCACVHSDAVECARRRDGYPRGPLNRRYCECVCHTEAREDERDEADPVFAATQADVKRSKTESFENS
jgi:hypothetical protein